MSIYNKNGQVLSSSYAVNGIGLPQAYNINGIPILTPKSLKVATYNVGQWYLGNHDNVPAGLDADYYALQNGMIGEIDADILLLEEYTQQFSKLPRTARSLLEQYYPYIHEQGGTTTTTGYGRCVCSKYPITNYVAHNYTQGSPFYYDSCVITAFGIQFNIIVTHIYWTSNPSDTTRDAEVAELIAFANNKSNVIIGGDFNNGLKPDQSETDWNDRYNRFVKPFVDVGYNTANYDDFGNLVTCYDGSDSSSAAYCLDNIYTSPNLQITNAYVDTTKLTDQIAEKIDHMPLITEVQIN